MSVAQKKNLIAENTFYDAFIWEFSPIFVMFKLYDAVIPRLLCFLYVVI
jgi:hypothetical protein